MSQNTLSFDLIQTEPGVLFRRYFLHSLLSTVMTAAFVLCDTIFIGRGVGSDGLAALNIALPCYTLMTAFAQMLGAGGATAISYSKGQGKDHEANGLFTTAILLAAVVSLSLGALGCIFWKPIAYACGAADSIITLTGQYLTILNGSAVVFVFNNMLGFFVRNDHAPRWAMIASVTGCLLNILLDYLFIFPLGFGMAGAISATVLSSGTSALLLARHFFTKKATLRLDFAGVSLGGLRRILMGGLPNCIAELSTGVVILLFNLRLMQLGGVDAVTSYSIISNTAYVFLAVFGGVNNTIQPLISFNAGAGYYRRVLQFLRYGYGVVFALCATLVAIGELFPHIIVQVFIANPSDAILSCAVPAIRFYFAAYLLMCFNMVSATFLQSVEQARAASVLSFCRGFLFLVPFLYLLSGLLGINGVWLTVPASELLTFAGAVLLVGRMVRLYRE